MPYYPNNMERLHSEHPINPTFLKIYMHTLCVHLHSAVHVLCVAETPILRMQPN